MEKLKHLEHLEDLVIDNNKRGALEALDIISGVVNGKLHPKEKFDGAPSIIAGINPENGRFFVATKSLFNKEPKINYNNTDILKNHGSSQGLCDKLRAALVHFPKVITSGIYQGDILFDRFNVGTQNEFTPNTITYTPIDQYTKRMIRYAEIGVVWHTRYHGTTIKSLVAEFNADTSELESSDSVFTASTDIVDPMGLGELTKLERVMIRAGVDEIKRLLDYMDLKNLANHKRFKELCKMFVNARIAQGRIFQNQHETVHELVNFITYKYSIEIKKYKTDEKKESRKKEMQDLIDTIYLQKGMAYQVGYMFEVHRQIQELKDMMVERFEKGMTTFTYSSKGVETGPEGFVVSYLAGAVKFVNRLEFSKNNFQNTNFR